MSAAVIDKDNPVQVMRSIKHYEMRLDIYKEMHAEIIKDLADATISCKVKGHLAKTGVNIEKYIDLLHNTITSLQGLLPKDKKDVQDGKS